MDEERPAAEKNLGVFFNGPVEGGGGFVVPMEPLNVGPGKPGPGDEWKMPVGPIQPEDAVGHEPIEPEGTVIVPHGNSPAE
jgi:hypothetical protein